MSAMDTTEASKNGTVSSENGHRTSDATDAMSSNGNNCITPEKTQTINEQEDSSTVIVPIYKKFKLRISKPLIPLKLALFIWYGAASAVATFLLVFYKQRGITLSELSTIYVITPALQLLGPTICGIIADKIGKSKPVLIANILLTVLVVVGMLLAPSMTLVNCASQSVTLRCNPQEFRSSFEAIACCDNSKEDIELASCNVTCPENVTRHCDERGLICEILEGNKHFENFSLSVHVSWAYKSKTTRTYNVTSIAYKNTTYSWCGVSNEMDCNMECLMKPEDDCDAESSSRRGILILNSALIVLFFTVFSNTYRFMDVTTMFLVKEHNADFGVHRVFAVAGILVFSPLAGYIVDAFTVEDDEKNYNMAFYFFIVMSFVLLTVIYKLEVQIRPPGKNMWRKSLNLLKNPDIITFVFILIVLGTAWNFNKNFLFWYLEGMDPPSFLLGLINSISALYGLPFLIISHWWVKKIGTTNIFLLALLGYVASGVGYSLIYDPRMSLLIEVSNIFTYHLLWVAVVVYCHSIAPEGLTATVISTAGGIHFSIGKGTGGLIGGRVMDSFGGRIAFRVIALICLTTAILYAIYLYAKKLCCKKNNSLDTGEGAQNIAFENDGKVESYTMKNKH